MIHEFTIAAPPVDRVGKADAQIVEAHLTIAASSITNNDKDSERPAWSEVGIDSITEPFANSIVDTEPNSPARPFMIGSCRYEGRFLYMNLIFFSTFFATVSLIEIIFIFLLG